MENTDNQNSSTKANHMFFDFFKGVQKRMWADFESVNPINDKYNLVINTNDYGEEGEAIFRKFLTQSLPPKIHLGSGQIWSAITLNIDQSFDTIIDCYSLRNAYNNNRKSKTGQIDLFIYRDTSPALPFISNDVHLIEGIFAFIEVKTNLTDFKESDVTIVLEKSDGFVVKIGNSKYDETNPQHSEYSQIIELLKADSTEDNKPFSRTINKGTSFYQYARMMYSFGNNPISGEGLSLNRPLRILLAFKTHAWSSSGDVLQNLNNNKHFHICDVIYVMETDKIYYNSCSLAKAMRQLNKVHNINEITFSDQSNLFYNKLLIQKGNPFYEKENGLAYLYHILVTLGVAFEARPLNIDTYYSE